MTGERKTPSANVTATSPRDTALMVFLLNRCAPAHSIAQRSPFIPHPPCWRHGQRPHPPQARFPHAFGTTAGACAPRGLLHSHEGWSAPAAAPTSPTTLPAASRRAPPPRERHSG